MSAQELSKNKLVNRLCLLEMWERFGYYGMRSLLVLFIVKELGFTNDKAYMIYSLYAAICYIVPVFSGYLADKLLGYKKLLFTGAIIICCGHYFLIFFPDEEMFLYLGLAAIATGSGFFRGNIANMLGSVYSNLDNKERDNGFRKFYIAINFGSLLAAISCGVISELYGWSYAFGFAGLGMTIGLAILIASRKILHDIGNAPEAPAIKLNAKIRKNIDYLVGILFIAIASAMFFFYETSISLISIFGVIILLHLMYITKSYDRNKRQRVIFLLIMLFFFMLMFALEMQLGSFINLFTDQHINRKVFGLTIPTASLQALNPLTIIIIGSFVSYILKKKYNYNTLGIFGAGLAISALCFSVLYIGCYFYDSDFQINILFLVTSIMLLSLSELIMAPIIQSLVTSIIPFGIRGYMMGIVMLFLSYSNIIGGVILKNMLHIDKSQAKNEQSINSLMMYQECFLKIALFLIISTVIYIIMYKKLKKIYSNIMSTTHIEEVR